MSPGPALPELIVRHDVGEADVLTIVERHATIYRAEHGFDASFGDYVAEPLRAALTRADPADRIWVAECEGVFAGCIAMLRRAPGEHQLRWFLVEPGARRLGVGTRLLRGALDFADAQGSSRVVLWTVRRLVAAARLYEHFGFRLVEEQPRRAWGCDVVEQCYERLSAR